MPFRVKTAQPTLFVSISSNSGPEGVAVSAHVSLPLTSERMKLLRQLAGSVQWDKQLPQERITWQEVETIIAGHVAADE
jgi:hypothetical protein